MEEEQNGEMQEVWGGERSGGGGGQGSDEDDGFEDDYKVPMTKPSFVSSENSGFGGRKRNRSERNAVFDEKKRAEYLTGFHKRKLVRKSKGHQIALRKAQAERVESRKQTREAKKAQFYLANPTGLYEGSLLDAPTTLKPKYQEAPGQKEKLQKIVVNAFDQLLSKSDQIMRGEVEVTTEDGIFHFKSDKGSDQEDNAEEEENKEEFYGDQTHTVVSVTPIKMEDNDDEEDDDDEDSEEDEEQPKRKKIKTEVNGSAEPPTSGEMSKNSKALMANAKSKKQKKQYGKSGSKAKAPYAYSFTKAKRARKKRRHEMKANNK